MSYNQRQSRLSQNQAGGMFSGTGAAIMGNQGIHGYGSGSGALGVESKITVNLEDVSLHEQKLNTILEVSKDSFLFNKPISFPFRIFEMMRMPL
jgi:hypothetical protein